MIENIVGDTYKQYGFLGIIVLLLGMVITYIIWDRIQDFKKERKKEDELEQKKKSGDYVSWESMNERIREMEGELNRHIEKSENQGVEIGKLQTLAAEHEKSDVKQFGHVFDQHATIFQKLDTMSRDMNENFKELIIAIKKVG